MFRGVMVWLELSRVPTGSLVDEVEGKYEPGVSVKPCPWRLVCDEGGCEKAFGCGVNTFSSEAKVLVPRAVESSSSSSSSWDRIRPCISLIVMSSFELLITRSDSLSLSSYSSWH
jgi:hypothetical protein